MSGYTAGKSPYDHGASRLPPPGKAALDGYQKDIINGFEKEAPRYNPMNPERTQTSAMVDLKDPIQVHLLTETALSDSKEYEILSQEEVDDLKKQSQFIMQRIESVRTNLGIQAKFRDAAISMAKLYSPGTAEAKRRSFLNGARNSAQSMQDAEAERLAAEKKCEELAIELFELEKRLMEPNRRLLQHTAGVLQLTHKASNRRIAQQNGQLNGMPGSPESLYTYPHSRASMDHGGDGSYIDDSGLYQLDQMPPIPVKSPIREQNSQLREEAERNREDNKLLRSQILDAEKELKGITDALRETIVRFSPTVNHDYDDPPQLTSAQNVKSGDLLRMQLGYLDSGLVAVRAEQESFAGGKATGERIEAMNLQLRDALMTANYHYTPKPIPMEDDVEGQLAYLEESLQTVDAELSRAASAKAQGNEDTEARLTELWSFIQNGFAETKRQKEERRRARQEKGLEEDEDMSDEEAFDANDSYSLEEFTSRVRWLSRQTTILKDHKSVLQRQIKQQRELNNKSDAEKDSELSKAREELEHGRQLLQNAEKDALEAEKMLGDALKELEQAKAALQNGSPEDVAALEAKMEQLHHDMAAKEEKFRATEAEMEQLHVQVAELKTEATIAKAELDGAYGSRAERAADAAAQQSSEEVGKLQDQVSRLKEELSGTVQELESITKESIGSEREKVELESKLDEALSSKSTLENEVQKARDHIAKLQEDLDGERLKAGGGGKASAGATMLSEQFRATMREERKKFQEDLREERTKSRKLEEELNRLKRSMGPGKSPLSPRS